MDRIGHSTTRAAMAYLHASDERQQAIADELSRQADAIKRPDLGRSDAAGTPSALANGAGNNTGPGASADGTA